MQCFWPTLPDEYIKGPILKVMLLADPHIVGVYRGHYLDRMRRDWEMTRAFESAMRLLSPEVVFILGDLFDEGLWTNDAEFERQLLRYHRIFAHDSSKTIVKNVVGNHDIGFHYDIHPYLDWRFRKRLTPSQNTAAVRLWIHKGIPFVLANSMAFEGDQCDLCNEATVNVNAIGQHLLCSPRIRLRNSSSFCQSQPSVDRLRQFLDTTSDPEQLKEYTQPILLQHFPLYRPNELVCAAEPLDAMPREHRSTAYRPKWDCLSEHATSDLLKKLRPRLILSGHSHYSCVRYHAIPGEPTYLVPEQTVASFSWRNLPNPSFLLMSVTRDYHAITKCYLPRELSIVLFYVLGIAVIFFGPCVYRCCQHLRWRWSCDVQ